MLFALINETPQICYFRENLKLSDLFKGQGGYNVKKRMTITEVAELIGISPKTLARWEKMGKIRRPKRDWRGWRVYEEVDVSQIKEFHETLFEV